MVSAFRRDRASPEARLFYAYHSHASRGPWPTWEFLRDEAPFLTASPDLHSSFFAMKGHISAAFRDQATSQQCFARAHEIAPDSAWVWTEQSHAFVLLDEPEAALEAAQHALALRPLYRPALQQTAQLLIQANRDADAIELFQASAPQLESGSLYQQWIVLLSEREDYAGIPPLCNHAEAIFIWPEKLQSQWITARRMDAAYGMGDFARAADLAAQIEGDEADIARLRAPSGTFRRAKLSVPFVRQDDATCAPASLASVAAYWDWDIRQDQVAEAVCYGGTFPHHLRAWVEGQGWIVREFKVTWENLRALIDRGVPFLLATAEATSGHMQVIEGYDEIWETILIRDPNFRHHRKVKAAPFLQRYSAFGPRGMIILAPKELSRLDGLDLESASGFDQIYRQGIALEAYDRLRAVAALTALESEARDTFLILAARLALADYDENPVERLKCLDELEQAGFRHSRFISLRLLTSRNFISPAQYLEALRTAATAKRDDAHLIWDPSFSLHLAAELSQDEAHFPEVRRLFFKYHLSNPVDSSALSFWAHQLWSRGQRDSALDLMRFAATAGDKIEQFSLDYFAAARLSGLEHTAVAFLEQRVALYLKKSSLPSETLYSVYRTLHRDAEAFQILSEAIRQRSGDGQLLLFCAYEWAVAGAMEEGRTLLESARTMSKRSMWLRTAASLSSLSGDVASERDSWMELARLEPLALDAHSQISRLLAMTGGPTAAIAYWEERCRDFPFHLGFAERRFQIALLQGDAYAEPFARQWLDLAPRAIVPRLEIIRLDLALGRFAEASTESAEACAASPFLGQVWHWRGRVLEETGDLVGAGECYRAAIRYDVDQAQAIERLWWISRDRAEQLNCLNFVEDAFQLQVFGEASFMAWFGIAGLCLSRDDLRLKLEHFRHRRPASLSVWCCSIRHLVSDSSIPEALALAKETVARFSLAPNAWQEAAAVQERSGDFAEALVSLRRALDLDPFLTQVWARQAWLLERMDRRSEAAALLARTVQRNPLDGPLKAVYAGILWRQGRHDDALATARAALLLSPGNDWTWQQFAAWCAEENRLDHLREFARSLAATRPGDADIALRYANTLRDCGHFEEAHTIVDRLLGLNPRSVSANLFKIELLTNEKRYDEARIVCDSSIWLGNPPTVVQGQGAWIEHSRGNLSGAIGLLQKLMRRDPSYIWGWDRLAEWLLEMKRPGEALDAAQRAADLQPDRGAPWVQLASIHDQLGHTAEATRIFREAVQRDPSYDPGVLLLVIRLIKENREDDATRIIAASSGAISPAFVHAAHALLFFKARRDAEATLALEKLFLQEGVSYALIRHVRENLPDSKIKAFLNALGAAIWKPGVQSSATCWWVEEKLAGKEYRLGDSLVSLPIENHARRDAIRHYLSRVNELGLSDPIWTFFQKHSAQLREDDTAWALIALFFCEARIDEMKAWTSDWRHRTEAAPWMLRPAAILALARGELAEGFAIGSQARSTGIRDHTYFFHALVEVFEKAAAGDTATADSLLARLSAIAVAPEVWEMKLKSVVEVFIRVKKGPAGQERRTWLALMPDVRKTQADRDPLLSKLITFLSTQRSYGGSGASPSLAPSRESFRPVREFRETAPSSPPSLPVPSAIRLRGSWVSLIIAVASFLLMIVVSVVSATTNDYFAIGMSVLFFGGGSILAGIIGAIAALRATGSRNRWTGLRIFCLLANLVFPVGLLGFCLLGFILSSGQVVYSPRPVPALPAPQSTPLSPVRLDAPFKLDDISTTTTPPLEPILPSASSPSAVEQSPVFQRAVQLKKQGDFASALALFLEAKGEFPNELPVLLESADILLGLGRYDEGLDVAQHTVDLFPGNGAAWSLLGAGQFHKQRYPAAEESLRKALELDPRLGRTWVYVAKNFVRLENWEEAKKAYITAIKNSEIPDSNWRSLAEIYMRLNDAQGGVKQFEVLLEAFPNDPVGLGVLGGLQGEAGMPYTALETLQKSLQMNPNNPDAWNILGLTYLQTENPEKALQAFTRGVEIAPANSEILNNRGFSLLTAGDVDQAITVFNTSLSADPTHTRSMVNLASAYIRKGDIAQAREVCDRLEKIDPALAAGIRSNIR